MSWSQLPFQFYVYLAFNFSIADGNALVPLELLRLLLLFQIMFFPEIFDSFFANLMAFPAIDLVVAFHISFFRLFCFVFVVIFVVGFNSLLLYMVTV